MTKERDDVGAPRRQQRGWLGPSLASCLATQVACRSAEPAPPVAPHPAVGERAGLTEVIVAAPDAGSGPVSSTSPPPLPPSHEASELQVWLQDDTRYDDCPLAPGPGSPRATLAPAQLADAWRETLRAWEAPGYFTRWRQTTQRAGAPYRRGRLAYLFVEERPNQRTRVWFDARHLQLPRELRADTPEQAGTLLIGFSQCFAEYPPGQLLQPPSHLLWLVREQAAMPVQLKLDEAIGPWALALPAR